MSTKVFDIFSSLSFVNDYNANGLVSNDKIVVDTSGYMTIFNTNFSVNSSTGALILQNGGLSINATKRAVSISEGGTVTVAGGVSIAKNLIVGESIVYSDPYSVGSTLGQITLLSTDPSYDISRGALITYGGISINTTFNATSITSGGALTIAGGTSINSDLYVGGDAYLNSISSGNSNFYNTSISNLISDNSDLVTLNSTTANLVNVYSDSITSSNIETLNLTTENLIVSSLNVYGNLNTLANIYTNSGFIGINNTDPSYTLDINGAININNTAGIMNIMKSDTLSDVLEIENTNISGGSAIQFNNNLGVATSYIGYGNSYDIPFQNTAYFYSEVGIPIKLAAGNLTSNPVMLNAADNSMSVMTTTEAFDTSSGALKVSGGVGIVGNVYIGGHLNIDSPFSVNILNTQASTNSTTGAMELVGGLSINVTDKTNSNATSYTAGGGITLDGGLAVSEDTYIGGTLNIRSGSSNMNPILLQSLQIYSNNVTGTSTSTLIQSGNATRTPMSFTPIKFSGWNDGSNPKMTINVNTIDMINSLNSTNDINTLGNLFSYNGRIGIGNTTPNSELQLSNDFYNRKIVLHETNNNDHQVYGFGVSSGSLRYQVDDISSDHVFYAGIDSVSSMELLRIKGNGEVSTGSLNAVGITAGNINFTGSLYKDGDLYISSQWTGTTGTLVYYGTSGSELVGIGTSDPSYTLDVNGNINFAGALYKNGDLYISSQWTGTTGSLLYYGTTGSVLVGIGTSNPAVTLDVNGDVRIQGTSDSLNSTSGSLIVAGGVAVGSTTDSDSVTSGGALTVAGGAAIAKSLSVGSHINLSGINTQFSGSFEGANNVTSPADITGLIFPSSTIRSFNVMLSISITRSAGGNYFAQYSIDGVQNDNGWIIEEEYIGDNTGLDFSINTDGQIQYKSPNYVNWSSTVIRYTASAVSVAGTWTPPVVTSGNFGIPGVLTVVSTDDSTNTSTGAIIVSGGIGITKNISIGGNIIMENSYMFSGSFQANNNQSLFSDITGLLFPSSNFRSFNIQMSIDITATDSLYEQCTIEGIQTSTGWSIYVTNLGDDIDFLFDITGSGQLQYSSNTNYTGWVSTTLNYQVTAIAIGGANTPITLPTSGNQTITGGLAITSTQNATSISSGALTVNGGIACAGDLKVGGTFEMVTLSVTDLEANTIMLSNINHIFVGSFSANNNQTIEDNITGLYFDTTEYRSFSIEMTASLLADNNLYQKITIEGIQSSTGWKIFVQDVGDIIDLEFSITPSGQLRYTSPNYSGWISTTLKYQVTAIKV